MSDPRLTPQPPLPPPLPPAAGEGGAGNLVGGAVPYSNLPASQAPFSGVAIASLVVSLMLCVPLLSAVVGLVLSILAFPRTAPGRKRGRGMAIAALVVSIVSFLAWSGIGLALYGVWTTGRDARDNIVQPMLTAIGNQDIPGAQKYCNPVVTPAELQTLADYIKINYGGAVASVDLMSAYSNVSTGQSTLKITCKVHFQSGKSAPITCTILRGTGGSPDQIYNFTIK